MNIKLKALSYTVGLFAAISFTVTGINYLTPEHAQKVVAAVLLGYLMYLMYSIKLGELKWRQDRDFDK